MGGRPKVALSQINDWLTLQFAAMPATEIVVIVCQIILAILLIHIARSDIRERTIGNNLVVAVALLGFVVLFVKGCTWDISNIIAIGAAFLLLATLWHLRSIGGGDVKLILACLVWIQPGNVLVFAALIVILGGFLGLAVLVSQRIRGSMMQKRIISQDRARRYLRLIWLRDHLVGSHASVPYAVAIAGALALMLIFQK